MSQVPRKGETRDHGFIIIITFKGFQNKNNIIEEYITSDSGNHLK